MNGKTKNREVSVGEIYQIKYLTVYVKAVSLFNWQQNIHNHV